MDRPLNKVKGKALAEKIAAEAEVKLCDCYQCGKCTAGCPMAEGMDLMPRQLVECLKMGMMEVILKSKSIWLCASCHTCVDRCPHDINIPGLMEGSRMEAKRRGICAVPEVDKFTDIFMDNVKMFGRNQEVVLEGRYNVSTGHLMQDMLNVPHMLKHKIVGPEIRISAEASAVKALVKKSEELVAKEEYEKALAAAEQRKGM